MPGPLVTLPLHQALLDARRRGVPRIDASVDLGRTREPLEIDEDRWASATGTYPYLGTCRDRTIYYWTGQAFAPVARYDTALIKLVPTEWGPPTFEIDGIKMLPTSRVSPYEDARRKVDLIRPRGHTVLDTCGGLGYFAACCLEQGASRVLSFEKNADVLWLRSLNPWSPQPGVGTLELVHGDVTARVRALPDATFDAVLHDPPRFGMAGELYSGDFYAQLARVLRPRGRLFHYTGSPNRLTSGRDVPQEVARRLRAEGFKTEASGDGVFAVKPARKRS
ncbi:MAG TPA: MnmC family methyltransferase [Steroidobacteraceae bacterium]|nr:MnmC family methyltransferase [Steroidobacteraceae bacterium]